MRRNYPIDMAKARQNEASTRGTLIVNVPASLAVADDKVVEGSRNAML
jgi:hypothetical protein